MKKMICCSAMILIVHSTVLSMMHTKKTVEGSLRLQRQKKVYSENGLKDDVRDAAFLRNTNDPSSLMDEWDKGQIRKAYIRSIYQVAQIEAMCKIQGDPNLSWQQKRDLVASVPTIVRE